MAASIAVWRRKFFAAAVFDMRKSEVLFVEKLNFVSRETSMSVIQGDGSGQQAAHVRMVCFSCSCCWRGCAGYCRCVFCFFAEYLSRVAEIKR